MAQDHGDEERKAVTIVVNGTEHAVEKDDITYTQVVKFFAPDYSETSGITYSVKYKRGHGDKPEGTLAPGASVKVKEGMVFSVSETGQS